MSERAAMTHSIALNFQDGVSLFCLCYMHRGIIFRANRAYRHAGIAPAANGPAIEVNGIAGMRKGCAVQAQLSQGGFKLLVE